MKVCLRALLAVLLHLLSFCAAPVRADDWPQFRGPNRDGVWNETGIVASFQPGGLNVSWRVPVGKGVSTPVVAQGRVVVTDALLQNPSATERVVCYDESNGQQLWSHQYAVAYPDWAFNPQHGTGPRSTPIIADGRLFTLGGLGHLFCLEFATGAVVWEKDLAKDYGVKEFTGISASPLLEDDLLILQLSAKPAACVVAFDKNTGREVWKGLDDSFTYCSPIILTAGGKRQLIVWTQEAVTSMNPATGEIWWREAVRTPGDMAVATPVFSEHRLLAAGLMFELDAGNPTAKVLWPETRAAAKRVLSNTSTPLFRGEYVYSAKTTGELVCLEAATGKEVWQTNTVTELGNGSSIHLTPVGDSMLLFTDQGDLLLAHVTPEGYTEISRTHLIEPTSPYASRKCAWTPPAYANRHIFVRNNEELVCASLAAEP